MIRTETHYWLECGAPGCSNQSPRRKSVVEATEAALLSSWQVKAGIHRCDEHRVVPNEVGTPASKEAF